MLGRMITFSGNPLDRLAARREDSGWLAARLDDPATRVVGVRDGKLLVRDGRLATLPAALAGAAMPRVFLGVDGEVAVFAIDIEHEHDAGTFEEMRPLALVLPHGEAAIAGEAKSLLDWHRRHGFCAVCGHATDVAAAGWKRICPQCGAEHFPRVDPVVIMLPVFGDRCLLGRQAAWPPGRMSTLAGFMEPGESIEEACAREMHEEAGLVATSVHYVATQPWPFPSTLMIGLIAEVANEDAVADGVELEAVRWLTREEAKRVVAGEHPEVSAPNAYAIAHHLLNTWANGLEG
ncbi:MAG: diphosphatase [Acidobacteriota bacterium]|jgi:NAD+ diphosphatase|nr:diphosphatase [Acidobacteriota bacterium]